MSSVEGVCKLIGATATLNIKFGDNLSVKISNGGCTYLFTVFNYEHVVHTTTPRDEVLSVATLVQNELNNTNDGIVAPGRIIGLLDQQLRYHLTGSFF